MKPTVSGKSAVYAILGDPIKHAMSPVLMNKHFERTGVDGVFLALKSTKERFSQIFPILQELDFAGYVFTMPVKEIAFGYMHTLTEEAQIIGAINCAVNKDGQLLGLNTDSIGFWNAVDLANDKRVSIKKAFILGCGGFSKSAIAQLAIQGIKDIVVTNRLEEKEFVDSFKLFEARLAKAYPSVRITLIDWIPSLWIEHLRDCDLVANGTPNGMGDVGDLDQIFPYGTVRPETIFFDAIYHPRITKFLAEARNRGHIGVEGLDLLVHQGAVSFHAYTSKEANPSLMKDDILSFWNDK